MRSGCLVGAVRPLSSWTSHTYTTTLHTYSSCHNLHLTFSSLASRPRHPLVIRGSFPAWKDKEVLDPPGRQVADPPQSPGFCLQLPTLLSLPAAFLLSKPTIFSRPPHQAPKCPTAFPILASSATLFAFLPSNILSQTKTPCFPISGAPCQRPNMVGCNI